MRIKPLLDTNLEENTGIKKEFGGLMLTTKLDEQITLIKQLWEDYQRGLKAKIKRKCRDCDRIASNHILCLKCYANIHLQIKKQKPKPKICEECNSSFKLELANISGEYRRDINDFKWLCNVCHRTKYGRQNWKVRLYNEPDNY